MLDIFRRKAQSPVIQALVVVIALVFVFWGVGGSMGNKRNLMATVNKEEISLRSFQKAYDRAVESYRKKFNGTIPKGLLEGMGVKQQVLSQLLQNTLLRQGGEQMGVIASTYATQQKIQAMKAFQKEGNFDMDRYKLVLSQNHLTPNTFEADIQSDLLVNTAVNNIKRFTDVTNFEIESRLGYANEEINLAYVALTGDKFKDKVEISDDKLAAYFKEHQNTYRTDPQVKLQYLSFPYDETKATSISDDELKAKYEETIDSYRIPEKRHARHILFTVADKNNQLEMDVQRKKATQILERAKKGEDFSALAKEFSQGPSASKGGDLGFFARGNMVKSFEDATFNMQVGSVSDIVETNFGFHIIKLEEIKPAKIRTFDEVKSEIAAKLSKQQAKKASFTAANDAYESIIKTGSIKKYSEAVKDTVSHTDFFFKKSPPKGITENPQFLENAFKLKKGELSSVIETNKGYAIIFIDDIKKPTIPELDSVRDLVTKDFISAQADQLAEKAARTLLTNSKENGDLQAAAATLNFEVKNSGFIRLDNGQTIAKLPGQVIKKGFGLSEKSPLPEDIVSAGKTFYVFKLIARQQPDTEIDDKKKQQLKKQLLAEKQNRLLTNWLAFMETHSKVWINNQLLQ